MAGVASSFGTSRVSARVLPFRPAKLWRVTRRHPLGAFGLLVVTLITFGAILAPLIAPYGINEQSNDTLTYPSWHHLLGTDNLGRDLFSRILYGSRISVTVGFASVALGSVIGLGVGLLSGYSRGWLDELIQRAVDAGMTIPPIFLAIVLITSFGRGLPLMVLSIGLIMAPRIARYVRGSVLLAREATYIEAARSVGCSDVRIMVLHIVPNILPGVIVVSTAYLSQAVLVESSLSFLGLGTQPPNPSWGNMLSGAALQYIYLFPWLAIPAGLALSLLVLSLSLLGDALRDVLDPRLRS